MGGAGRSIPRCGWADWGRGGPSGRWLGCQLWGVPAFLGCSAWELEEMGWGTRPGDVDAYLPPGARFETLDGVGHFVHIEAPELVADMIGEFLS